MPPLRQEALALALDGLDDGLDDELDDELADHARQPRSSKQGAVLDQRRQKTRDWDRHSWTKSRRDGEQESFKCRDCRAFVGPTISGGRHRNHCPLCLYSRHVDAKRPGDRASTCGALMAPIGTFHRPKGEQVVLHRCLGCGQERHNRIAADDNPVRLLHLPLVPPRTSKRRKSAEEEAIA